MGSCLAPWQSPPAPEEQSGANERVWGRREFATGVTAGSIAGLIAAVFTVVVQAVIDDRREAQADRREDVRFVRQIAADGTPMFRVGKKAAGRYLDGSEWDGLPERQLA